jgi:hypothetical protein
METGFEGKTTWLIQNGLSGSYFSGCSSRQFRTIYFSRVVLFMVFTGITTISYRHSGQRYVSQPVQAKQLLHDFESSFLSQDFPQWEQVIHVDSSGFIFALLIS